MQQHLAEEWLSWHFISCACCPGTGLKEKLQMIKSGSGICKFVTSPQITAVKGFLALKLNYACWCGLSITPPASGLPAPRSTLAGKHKSITSANALGQMLMVTLGLGRSCGLVLSPFSFWPMAKTSVCSLFINNLLSMQCWYTHRYSTNISKRKHLAKEETSITLYCLDRLQDPFAHEMRMIS